MRGVSFELLDNPVGAVYGFGLDKEMDMVRHYFHLDDRDIDFFGFLEEQASQMGFDVPREYFPSIFWAPD